MSRLFLFYSDGFRDMSVWGRRVWVIIIIKLFIMFAILKIFFFQDFLYKNFDNNKARSEHVLNQLINSPDNNDR
jgi:ABC-type Mn2+/Zn2+ transport system permease subunit